MEDNISNDSSDCSPLFSHDQLKVLGISQASAAILSTLACIIIFLIIIIFKKYAIQTQRLILYLIISVLLLNIGYIIRGLSYNKIFQGPFCSGIAFYTQYNGSCILLSVVCFTVEVFIRSGLFRENKDVNWNADKFYVPVIFVLPLLADWIPFINDAYGPTKTWCWIRIINFETCDIFLYGLILQYALWYFPIFVGVVTGCTIYVITYIRIARQSKRYKAIPLKPSRQKEHQELLSDLKRYKWYPVIILLFNGVPFVARLITDINNIDNTIQFYLWVVAGVLQGLQGCVIALIFTLDPGTRKRLKIRPISAAIRCNILNHDVIRDYPVIAAESDSKFVNRENTIEGKDSLISPLIDT